MRIYKKGEQYAKEAQGMMLIPRNATKNRNVEEIYIYGAIRR